MYYILLTVLTLYIHNYVHYVYFIRVVLRVRLAILVMSLLPRPLSCAHWGHIALSELLSVYHVHPAWPVLQH